MARAKTFKTTAEVTAGVKDDTPGTNEPCSKCGQCCKWTGPHYRPEGRAIIVDRSHPSKVKRTITLVAERLQWACSVCGFTRLTPTKDTK